MRKKLGTFLIYCAAAVSVIFVSAGYLYPDDVAMVNGKPITREILNIKVTEALMKFSAGGQSADKAVVEKNVLEGLINNELIYQESGKKGYLVSDEMIEKQYSAIKGQFGSQQQFLAALGQRGYTEDSLREELGRVMAIDNYISTEIAPRVSVSEEETKGYYEENIKIFWEPETVRASHILAGVEDPSDEGQKEAALKKIKGAEKKLGKGEDFAAVAREYSDCPSGSQGGDLGYFRREEMVKPFSDAAFALETGGTSGIVETKFGYHIITLTDRKPGRTIPFEEVKGDIEGWLGERKVFAELKSDIDKLKEKAKIERFL